MLEQLAQSTLGSPLPQQCTWRHQMDSFLDRNHPLRRRLGLNSMESSRGYTRRKVIQQLDQWTRDGVNGVEPLLVVCRPPPAPVTTEKTSSGEKKEQEDEWKSPGESELAQRPEPSSVSYPSSSAAAAAATAPTIATLLGDRSLSQSSGVVPQPQPQPSTSISTKQTSRKAPDHRVRKVKAIHLKPDGTFSLQAKYGRLTVLSLGEITDTSNAYHTDRYIYPVGYTIQRLYASTLSPDQDHVLYTARILPGPLFEVLAEDGSGVEVKAKSTSGAWAPIVNAAAAVRGRRATNAVCGPDLFGLTCPEVAMRIQGLPRADQCKKYKWQTFLEQ